MKLRKAARVIILGILHILILLPKVLCTGMFELRLSSFTNVHGLDANERCCNGDPPSFDGSNQGSETVCRLPCHTFFTICLTHYMSNIPPDYPTDLTKQKCEFGYVRTDVLGGNDINFNTAENFSNPLSFRFNVSWPGTFSIIIETWHDSTLSTPATGSPRKLISRLAAPRELAVGHDWKSFIYQTSISELKYKYRVTCIKDYYDPGCDTLCKPRNDHFGHYTCSENGSIVCNPGWRGSYCDQAICLEGCEEEHGYCSQPYTCKCRIGWEGRLCKECTRYPGCSNGTCTKPNECNCDEGWGGFYCNQDLNYCTHHSPCQNGGVCLNSGSGSYTCSCLENYTGTNCEREIDDCLNRPCQNGGSCEDSGTGYKCRCQIGFTGKTCETPAESCEKNPCKYGATCVEGQGSYTCLCRAGYTGRNCDQEIYECDPNPCHNDGRCVDEVNGFRCVCESGFTGSYCEINLDDCSPQPCQNGATCIDRTNDFECRCVPGFIGNFCETNVDDCLIHPCANGGLCHDKVNDFNCTCRPGFTGRFCTEDIDECASNPCQNGAKCTQSVDDYYCACAPIYSGKNCQYLPGQTSPDPVTDRPLSDITTPKVTTKNNMTLTEQHTDDSDEITMTKLLLIVCLGVGIPLLLIIIAVTILLCRKRRLPDTSKEEAENVQNSINNKLRESKIFTTIPQSSSTISNLTSKISNEDTDFNTLKSYRSSRPSSQIYIGEKQINKPMFYNKDLHVHSKHKDFEKTTKKLQKEKMSIDPSNLDVRDYCSSQDIHFIEKHTNRDILNRNSLLILESQIHPEPHHHSSFYGDDVLATEV